MKKEHSKITISTLLTVYFSVNSSYFVWFGLVLPSSFFFFFFFFSCLEGIRCLGTAFTYKMGLWETNPSISKVSPRHYSL